LKHSLATRVITSSVDYESIPCRFSTPSIWKRLQPKIYLLMTPPPKNTHTYCVA